MKKEQGSVIEQISSQKMINDVRTQAQISLVSIPIETAIIILAKFNSLPSPYQEIILAAAIIPPIVGTIEFARILKSSIKTYLNKEIMTMPGKNDLVITPKQTSVTYLKLGDDGEIITIDRKKDKETKSSS